MGRFYYIITFHDVATNLHLQGLIYCMNVFTLNIRKDLHGVIGTLYITGMYLIALALWASFVDLVTSEHISWGRPCIIEIKINIGVISMAGKEKSDLLIQVTA
jgi:hypothetical protein